MRRQRSDQLPELIELRLANLLELGGNGDSVSELAGAQHQVRHFHQVEHCFADTKSAGTVAILRASDFAEAIGDLMYRGDDGATSIDQQVTHGIVDLEHE